MFLGGWRSPKSTAHKVSFVVSHSGLSIVTPVFAGPNQWKGPQMKTSINTKYDYADLRNTARALKAIRLQKGMSRHEAAKKIGWDTRSLEALENARCNFSKERLQKILTAYDVSESEFERIRRQPKLALAETCEKGKADRTVDRKPRRNHLKVITKEVRVLRVLRKRRGLSQYSASKLCGFAPSMFGHIEEGRIELRPDRIAHILGSLRYTCSLDVVRRNR